MQRNPLTRLHFISERRVRRFCRELEYFGLESDFSVAIDPDTETIQVTIDIRETPIPGEPKQ